MNNTRRKALAELRDRLESLGIDVEAIKEDLEVLRDEEQEYIDNMPENLQGGEKYENAENAVSSLELALDEFGNIIGSIESALESIETAEE